MDRHRLSQASTATGTSSSCPKPRARGRHRDDHDPTGHFLVVCRNLDEEAVTEEQLQEPPSRSPEPPTRPSIATETLAGHQDVSQDTAAGANLDAHVSSGPQAPHRRPAGRRHRGPPDRLWARGGAIVADIEAGR